MIKVGLTGGFGSGKSTVSAFLKEQGYPVIDADLIARQVVTPPSPLLEQLSEGIVLGDGGYIVELEQRGWVTAGAFTPEVALEHPGAIRELYSEMTNAGADVIQVMAFYGSRAKLDTVGKDNTF